MASNSDSSNGSKASAKEPNGGDSETKKANPGVAFGEQVCTQLDTPIPSRL